MAEPMPPAPDVGNYDLLRTSDTPDDPSRMPQGPGVPGINVRWLGIAAIVAVAMVATYVIVERNRAKTPAAVKAVDAAAKPARPLGGTAAPIDVPPLDLTDPLVRELVKQLTSNPAVAAWLASDRLIRNFTVVVSNTADGAMPAVHLRVLRPPTNFAVIERGTGTTIDPRSYARYDGVAAAAASIDPTGAARLYSTLKPRIEEAYLELGAGMPFDRALELAIVSLLKVPVVPDPIAVKPEGGTGYAFVDPKLEALTPPQKHLLRTGSANVQTIQASLRAIALALGIPADRLPMAK